MSDAGNEDINDEAPRRRSTFTPPSEETEVPLHLGESASDSPPAPTPTGPSVPSSPVTPPPLVTPPPAPPVGGKTPLPPPVRSSLSDQEIVSSMGAPGSDTSAVIGALQEQLDLRKREDEEFESWEALIRQSYAEDEADDIVRHGRATFEGVPVEELEAVPEPAPEPVAMSEVDSVLPEQSPAEAAPEVAEPLGDIPADLAEGVEEAPDQAAPEESVEGSLEEPVGETESALDSDELLETTAEDDSFEAVLHDERAESPPTDAWPLAEVPVDASDEAPAVLPETEALEVEETYVRVDEVTVTGDGSVTDVSVESHEVLTVREVLDTKEAHEVPLADLAPDEPARFGFDHIGAEPTPENQRADSLLKVLWAWWAIGTPVPVFLLGTWLVSAGLSLTQAVLASVAGTALAAIPVVVSSLQGSRLGLPTLITSRAAFGMAGNIVPSLLMLLLRLAVAAVVIWSAAWVATGVLVESNYWNGEPALMLVILAAVFALIASGLAVAGRSVISVTLWVSAGLGTLALVGLVLLTLPVVSGAAASLPDADSTAVVAGISVVMAALMVFWAHFGGDLARFHYPGAGAASATVSAMAAVIPVVILLAWGAVLGGSSPEFTEALFSDPFDALLDEAPLWYPIPAIAVGALPLLGIASLALHSSGYALLSVGIAMPRYLAATIASAVASLLAISLVVFLTDLGAVIIPLVLFFGVLAAAWVGAFTGEVITRRSFLDPRVIAGSSGDFPRFRIAPFIGFLAALAVGWGVSALEPGALSWTGYLLPLLAQGGLDLADWNIGPLASLVVSLVFSLFAGIQGGAVTTDRRSRTE